MRAKKRRKDTSSFRRSKLQTVVLSVSARLRTASLGSQHQCGVSLFN
jgi:hypothetical protein